ncbi:hypothetical protein Tco_0609531 [Tanacetum coccineum]
MESVKKSIYERAQHKREYDKRVNDRKMQTKEGKVDSSKALDAGLVVTKSNGTESEKHVTSNRFRNDTHAKNADIKPVNNKEPMVVVQMIVEYNVLANGQHHTEQPEFKNEGRFDQVAKQYQVKSPLLDDELSKTNDMDAPEFCAFFKINELKAQLQVKTTLISNLKKQIKNMLETSNEANVKNDIDVVETINIELEHGVAKLLAENEQLHKENAHLKQPYKELYDSIKKTSVQNKDNSDSLISQINQKSIEIADLKAQIQEKVFANAALTNKLWKFKGNSVDTKFVKASILGKPPLQPSRNHSVVRQPNAFKNSKNESYSSNDMSHNYSLEEAIKKTQDRYRNLKPRDMASARTHHTPNACTPKPRNISRSLQVSKSSCVTSNVVPLVDHSRKSSSFSDSKHFVCLTCQKCILNANHDSCVTKFLNEVNSRAQKPSHKTTIRYKPVEKMSSIKKPVRQISTGHMFSTNKSSTVQKKTKTPRSCLRWKPMGKIFNTVGLRWVPTGKIFTSSTTKVDRKLPHGSYEDITNLYECEQTLNVSARLLT